MERNHELMFKLTPLFISGDKLFLSGYEGDLFEYEFGRDKLSPILLEFVFVSDLFVLMQEANDEQYLTSIFFRGRSVVFYTEDLIEDMSIIYHENSHELVFYTASGVMSLNLLSIESSTFNIVKRHIDDVLPRGFVHMANGVQIDLYSASLKSAHMQEALTYDAILSISEAGILFKNETDSGNDAYLASPRNDKIEHLDLNGANVCSACYDASSSQYYFSVIEKGQQRAIRLCDSVVCNVLARDGLSGTVTPCLADNFVFLYVTGSTEGVRIIFPDRHMPELILSNPPSERKRIYYENPLLKITSLISAVPAKINVLFFHGGPESCEWDSPRLPGLINALPNTDVSFHIVNYAGSSGYGERYRTVADGRTLTHSLPPLIHWINNELRGSHLILCGGSFGGSLVLDLMNRKEHLAASISGSVITNPLLDLDFHIERVREHDEDIGFFEKKFSDEDRTLISTHRYTQILNETSAQILLILGRRDEVVTIKPAMTLLNSMRDRNKIRIHIDDGGHSPLNYFFERERKMTSFIQGIVADLS